MNSKKSKIIILILVIMLLAAAIGGGVWWAKKKSAATREKNLGVYEAMVQVRDQKSDNPAEDARASLKAGDVIVIFPEGHPWSETERISSLILKLKITPEEAAELTAPQTKEVKNGNTGGRGETGERETIRARAYRLKIEKLKFDPEKISEGQPFQDKVFDENLIQKK